MKRMAHALAGSIALVMVTLFISATLAAELALSAQAVAMVKGAIVAGLFVLIPAVIIAGGSGFALAKRRSGALLSAKKRRMPLIALNGLLVLLPAALYLDAKASAGELDAYFYAVQALELIFAAAQFRLLALNARVGMRLRCEGSAAAAVGSALHGGVPASSQARTSPLRQSTGTTPAPD